MVRAHRSESVKDGDMPSEFTWPWACQESPLLLTSVKSSVGNQAHRDSGLSSDSSHPWKWWMR